jgi:hypothetical protein
MTSDAAVGPTSFTLDGLGVLPPQVVAVGTVARSRGGLEAVTQMFLGFDATMAPSAGLATSFQLTAAGPDGIVETTGCGPLAGDDEAISIDAASYDSDTDTSHLWLHGGAPLSPTRYALFACADALADEDGNGLDGDGDGTPGGDHATQLLVKVDHLLVENPNFDSGLDGWTVSDPAVVTWGEDGIGGVVTSGSLFLEGLPGGAGPWSVEQCVAADALEVSFRLLGSAWVAGAAGAWATGALFGSGDCSGAPVAVLASPVLGDTGGSWVDLATPFHRLPVPGVTSARIRLQAAPLSQGAASGTWSAGWDEVAFWGASIFHGDFETGDTSRWSSSVGD